MQPSDNAVTGFDIEQVLTETRLQRLEANEMLRRLRVAVEDTFRKAGNEDLTTFQIRTTGLWTNRRHSRSYYWRMQVLEMVVDRMQGAQKGTWTVRLAPASEHICFFKKQPA
ncbi:MAG TPA: hypothetical protein V6D17_22085 [Candidatus Obscuribacterales bacterium]